MQNEPSDEAWESSLSLQTIDAERTPEERNRAGKSGAVSYNLASYKDDTVETTTGKVTEVGAISDDSGPMELRPLAEEGFTHYGLFRIEDRSSTTIIQSAEKRTYRAFSLGRSNVEVSYPIIITHDDSN